MPPESIITDRILRRVLIPAYAAVLGESPSTRISNPYRVDRIIAHSATATPTAMMSPRGIKMLPMCRPGHVPDASRNLPVGNTRARDDDRSRQYDVLS